MFTPNTSHSVFPSGDHLSKWGKRTKPICRK